MFARLAVHGAHFVPVGVDRIRAMDETALGSILVHVDELGRPQRRLHVMLVVRETFLGFLYLGSLD